MATEGGITPERAIQTKPEMGQVKPLEKPVESDPKKETLGKQKVKVFFTDHSPDRKDIVPLDLDREGTGLPENYNKTCETVLQMGGDFIRSDIRMNILYPQPGNPDQEAMDRYANAFVNMKDRGLEPGLPVIGSTLPEWMMDLYKKGDREGFQKGWQGYNQFVVENLAKKGVNVDKVQVLNELNHFIAPNVAMEDLRKMFEATREAFSQINPDVQVWTTLAVSSLLEKTALIGKGAGVMDYLDKLAPIAGSLDGVLFDQYAGFWDARPIEANRGRFKFRDIIKSPGTALERIRRNLFRFTDPLELAIRKADSMGLKVGIGEMGFPAKNEGQKQLEFFRNYPFALNRMFNNLARDGVIDGSEELMLGLYEVNDERYAGVPWEKYWGVMNEGVPKPVAQEGFVFEDKIKQAGREVTNVDQPARLRKMVDYLKRGSLQAIRSGEEQHELKQVRKELAQEVQK